MTAALCRRFEPQACNPDERREWGSDGLAVASSSSIWIGSEYVVIADSRVDNRDELARLLGRTGLARGGSSDAELLGRVYAQWGVAGFGRVLGVFAVAVHDLRRGDLVLARDAVGISPLYYHYRPGRGFAFSSEIKGLLALPWVPHAADEAAVARWLGRDVEDREGTLYVGIRRLPAAHTLTVRADLTAPAPVRYWSLGSVQRLELGSDSEYVEAFLDRFTEAVRCRIEPGGDARVGAALTGGLDSSSIACVARDLLASEGRPLTTYSGVFPGLPDAARAVADETPWIEEVLGTGGMSSRRVALDQAGPLAELEEVLAEQDEPSIAVNLFIPRRLYAAAAEDGMAVYLEGTGGESAVDLGWEALREIAEAGAWERLAEELRLAEERWEWPAPSGLAWSAKNELHRLARAGRWIELGRALAAIRKGAGVRRRHLAKWYGVGPFLPGRIGRGTPAPPDGPPVMPASLEYVLPMAARAAATRGLAVRYPFLDRRVLEFGVSLPASLRYREGWTRWLLRASMAGHLPDAVRWRTRKQDLTPGYIHGLRSMDQARITKLVPGVDLSGQDDPDAAYAVFQQAGLRAWRNGLARRSPRSDPEGLDVGPSRDEEDHPILDPPQEVRNDERVYEREALEFAASPEAGPGVGAHAWPGRREPGRQDADQRA